MQIWEVPGEVFAAAFEEALRPFHEATANMTDAELDEIDQLLDEALENVRRERGL